VKVLTDISINEINPFLFEMAKKAIIDSYPITRVIGLHSLVKILDATKFDLSENLEDLVDILSYAIKDSHLMVVEAALLVIAYMLNKYADQFEEHFLEKTLLKMIKQSHFQRICSNLALFRPEALPTISFLLAMYSSFFLLKENSGQHPMLINLMKAVTLALDYSLPSIATLSLINLYLFLRLEQSKGPFADTLKHLQAPIKRIFNDHHFDKLCLLSTVHQICI